MARWRRRLRRTFAWGLGLLGVLVAMALLALANLDAWPVKGVVQRLAAARGVQLDFTDGKVTLGGVRLRGVSIASPAVDAARAPKLLAIASIDGEWSLWSRRVDRLDIRGVDVTVVRSADGTTSLDRWLAGLGGEEKPPVPLPQALREVLPLGFEAKASVERVSLTVLDDAGAAGSRHLSLTGLGATMHVEDRELVVELASPALRVALVESGERELVVGMTAKLTLTPTHADVTVTTKLIRQTFSPRLPPTDELLSLDAMALFGADQPNLRLTTKVSVIDQAVKLDATVLLPEVLVDGALAPIIRYGNATVDLERLAAAVPPELGPLEAKGEPLSVMLQDVALAPVPSGTVTAAIRLARLRWRDVSLDNALLLLTATPAEGKRLEVQANGSIGTLRAPGRSLDRAVVRLSAKTAGLPPSAGAGADPLAALFPIAVTGEGGLAALATAEQRAGTLVFTVNATLASPRQLDASLEATVSKVAHGVGRAAASAELISLKASTRGLTLADLPLASRGDVSVELGVAAARAPDGTTARIATLLLEASLAGGSPANVVAYVDARQLVVPGLGASLGKSFAGGQARLELRAPKLMLDAKAPLESRGEATLTASYGGATVEGTLRGSASAVAWELRARAPQLGPAQNLAVTSAGDFAPGSGQLRHDSVVQLSRATTPSATVRDAKVHVVSSGTTRAHRGTVELAAAEVESAGRAVGATKLALDFDVDLPRSFATLRLRGDAPPADLTLAASVDGRRALRWRVAGKVAGLAALAAFLPPGPDWTKLAIDVDGQGEVSGVIAAMRDGAPVLVRDPALAARGHQRLALSVRELSYRDKAETRADLAAATLRAELDLAETRKVTLDLEVPKLDAVASGVKLGAEALAVRLDATLSLRRGPRDIPVAVSGVDATLTLRAKTARQTALPWYGVRAPELTARVSGDPAGTLALALAFANPGGGTALELAGELERADELAVALAEAADPEGIALRRSLVLQGKLAQVLDGLDAAPETLRAKGKVTVPFRVESGDLSLFRATAQIALAEVSASLPKQKIDIAKVNGELPVVQELVVDERGVHRVGQGEHGLFSQLRFPDYKPFSGGRDYLSIGELTVRGTRLGPAAGNVRVDRDLVALDQLELLALGGKISGQCVVELRGADTRLAFRGKATGVRPSAASASAAGGPSGDRLDANLALTITPYRLGLEGRTEIVQIGKDHLLALLDAWDPYRTDVSANRVRLGLKVGYPKQVRLHFSRGFATLAIELGGLAGVVRIDEIRGIPVGPVMSHFLAPILQESPDAATP